MSYDFQVQFNLPILNPVYGNYIGVISNGDGRIMFAIEYSAVSNDLYKFAVWRTEDYGINWAVVYSDVSNVTVSPIGNIISVSNSGKYVLFVYGINAFYSNDSGKTFTGTQPDVAGSILLNCAIGQILNEGDPPQLFLISLVENDNLTNVFRSSDGANTWEIKATRDFTNYSTTLSASYNNSDTQYVYFGYNGLIIISDDNAETFNTVIPVFGNPNTDMYIRTNGTGEFLMLQSRSYAVGSKKIVPLVNNLSDKVNLFERANLEETVGVPPAVNFLLSTDFGINYSPLINGDSGLPLSSSQVAFGCPYVDMNAKKMLVSVYNSTNPSIKQTTFYLGLERSNENFRGIVTELGQTFTYVSGNNNKDSNPERYIIASGGVVFVCYQLR